MLANQVPLDDHVEGNVFVASTARLDGPDTLPGQLHVVIGYGARVEPRERLN